ncbi:Holliday junction resolvase subunit Eme1 [Schizosaccharomyces octosporus yFS286]|uniref:Holliday junction resolvase subunit Eme1 n=1 Tax=Schizosaccharomyces octosporus (strain yFS286) TaxID=483514 RepID=S9PSQ0_SCHOY|nr:Holliday junction resolvase subunit Eme1 [Schizosaccharomyces octosporus yFS286]EPX72161.1 Holliday junction resolvase subunit Eme1 [Schizosaccharomyces octosporus yFS286]
MSKQNDVILIPSETDIDEQDDSSQQIKSPLPAKTNVISISETPQQNAPLGAFVQSVFTSTFSDSDDLLPSPRNALGIPSCESNSKFDRLSVRKLTPQPRKVPETPSLPREPIVLSSSPPSSVSHTSPLFAITPPSNLHVVDNFQREAETIDFGSSPLRDKVVDSTVLPDPPEKTSSFHENILDAPSNSLFKNNSPKGLSNALDGSLFGEKNLLQYSILSNRFADSERQNQTDESDENFLTTSSEKQIKRNYGLSGLPTDSGLKNTDSNSSSSSSSSKPTSHESSRDPLLFDLPTVDLASTPGSRKRTVDALSTNNSSHLTQSNDLQKLKKLKNIYSKSFQGSTNDNQEAVHNTLRKSKTMGKVGLSKKKLDEAERKKNKELQKINKVKRTKEECLSEMILSFSDGDLSSLWGASVSETLQPFSCEVVSVKQQPKNTISWKRKVNTFFDHAANRFDFVTEHIQNEPFSLHRIPCSDFVTKIADNILDDYIKSCKLQFPNNKLIIILEGVTSHFKNVKSDINRQYANAVNTGTKPLLFGSLSKYQTITKEVLESEVCRINVQHNVLLNYSNDEKETADWIVSITSDIALSRYKQFSHLSARISLAEIGHVKSADRAENTLNFMLRQLLRVTPNISNAICDYFPSIPKLIQHLKANGEESLSNIMITTAISERNLGTALSRRIFNTFMGRKSEDDAP